MKQITVVFPIGGKAQRFGGKFKPFLHIYGRTFLEHAIEPFLKHKDSIKEMIFLTTQEQSKEFNINSRIKSFGLPVQWTVCKTETADGIIADINKLIGDRSGLNNVIFCDCDHSLNVDEMMEVIQKSNYDVVLPVWPIDSPDKWSVVVTDDNGIVIDIKEKEYPNVAGPTHGVIGCYYFKRFSIPANENFKYLSHLIRWQVSLGQTAKIVHIKEAEFFGDPERLRNLYEEKKASTIFCDLDGTIIKHESEPDYSAIELLEGAADKIEQWRKENCFIVLTTSRDEQFRPEMEKLLREAGIRYEYLVMGLPPGTRHLINDKKPYNDAPMAVGHEVIRDQGIKGLELGNSLATLERQGEQILKTISYGATEYDRKKFKAQYDSMKAVSERLPDLIPKLGSYVDGVYSMEHLTGYVGLHQVEDKVSALGKLFEYLPHLYEDKVKCEHNWLADYIEEKIFSKKEAIAALGLDATEVYDRLDSLSIQEYDLYAPKYLATVHGDLTYENIMVKDESIKLIDFDNDNKLQPIEQDLGKLWQSHWAAYEWWDQGDRRVNIETYAKEADIILTFYSAFLGLRPDQTLKKAQFYCALHLIRMITYQAKRSMARAEKALDTAIKLLK